MRFLTLCVVSLLMVPAFANGLTGSVDLSTTQVEIIWVRSIADMRDLLATHNLPVNDETTHGFTLRGNHAETGEDVCIIYAIRPTEVNDKSTLVLGHEFLHCVIGDYHE